MPSDKGELQLLGLCGARPLFTVGRTRRHLLPACNRPIPRSLLVCFTDAAALPRLDPLSVSIVVIKSLAMLRPPLLDTRARTELLHAALDDYTEAVRYSIVSHVLHRVWEGTPAQHGMLKVRQGGWVAGSAFVGHGTKPGAESHRLGKAPPRPSLFLTAPPSAFSPSFQHLFRYLARLVEFSGGACTAEGLSGLLGPVLIDPETCVAVAGDPDTLTQAAAWVVQVLIR